MVKEVFGLPTPIDTLLDIDYISFYSPSDFGASNMGRCKVCEEIILDIMLYVKEEDSNEILHFSCNNNMFKENNEKEEVRINGKR